MKKEYKYVFYDESIELYEDESYEYAMKRIIKDDELVDEVFELITVEMSVAEMRKAITEWFFEDRFGDDWNKEEITESDTGPRSIWDIADQQYDEKYR